MKILKEKTVSFGEKITKIYIIFLVFVLPLFCFPNYSSITEWKFKLFFYCTLAYFALLTLGFIEISVIGKNIDLISGIKRIKNLPSLFFLLYLLASIASFAFSDFKATALFGGGKYDGLISVALYFLVFIAASAFGRLSLVHEILISSVVIINFVLVIVQFFGANPFSLYPVGMNYHDAFKLYAGEFLGTFGNVDVISAFLSIVIPFLFIKVLNCEGRKRLFFLLMLFPAVFSLVICKVLAGMLGCFVSLAVITFYITDLDKMKAFFASLSVSAFSAFLSLLLLKIFLPAFLLLALSLLFLFIFRVKSFHRKKFLISSLSIYSIAAACAVILLLITENSDSGRFKIWKDAIGIFLDSPLIGHGPGAYIEGSTLIFERYSEILGYNITSHVDCAHNIYLNILACGGIIGFLPFAAFLCFTVKKAVKTPFLPSILSFLALGFFSFEVCSVSAIFYMICGLAVNYNKN